MRRICYSAIYIALVVLSVHGQYAQSPCPNIFSYQSDGVNVYGLIRLNPTGQPVSNLHVRANFTVATRLPTTYIGQIESIGNDQVLQNYNRGTPLSYHVHFPVTSPLPRLTSIVVNGNTLCYRTPDLAAPNQYLTTISLEHMLFLKGEGSSDFFNQYEPVNNQGSSLNYEGNIGSNTQVFTINEIDNKGTWSSNYYPVNTIITWNNTRPINSVYEQPATRPNRPVFEQPATRPNRPVFEQPATRPNRPVFEQPATRPNRPIFEQPEIRPNRPIYEQPAAIPNRPIYEQPAALPNRPIYEQPAAIPNRPIYEQPAANPNRPIYEQPATRPTRPTRPTPRPEVYYPEYTTEAYRPPPPRPQPPPTTKPPPPPTTQPPALPSTPPRLPAFPTQIECGVIAGGNERIPLIYQGHTYPRGDLPWLVAVYKRQDVGSLAFICSGTLVSDRHVITAAHCMHQKSKLSTIKDMVVKIGVYNLEDWGDDISITRTLQAAAIHDSYNATTLENDILVLTLEKTVEFNTYIRPACLWTGNTDLTRVVGASGVVAGWGASEVGPVGQGEPRMVRIPIVSTAACRASKPEFHKLTSARTLCAGDRNGSGPCLGDSGGGLYILDSGRWRLRGVVSLSLRPQSGDNTCNLNEYIVFTDTAQYLGWIRKILSHNYYDT